jgi:hypothetical protein
MAQRLGAFNPPGLREADCGVSPGYCCQQPPLRREGIGYASSPAIPSPTPVNTFTFQPFNRRSAAEHLLVNTSTFQPAKPYEAQCRLTLPSPYYCHIPCHFRF